MGLVYFRYGATKKSQLENVCRHGGRAESAGPVEGQKSCLASQILKAFSLA